MRRGPRVTTKLALSLEALLGMGAQLNPEGLLFQAIFQGEVVRVGQLISSGLDKNGVLHCPNALDGATPLATASSIGRIPVMRVLIEAGVQVNFQDPCLGRSALHWAVMGGREEAVEFLLRHGANPNCPDRDSITPLMLAASHKQPAMVKRLLEGGARVEQADRLRSTALHYSTAVGASSSTQELVRAGSLSCYPSIHGTPLCNLLRHRDAHCVRMLLEAGYDVSNEPWQGCEVPKFVDQSSEAWTCVLEASRTVPGLKSLCRRVIRRSLRGPRLEERARKLPLPAPVVSFLLLESL